MISSSDQLQNALIFRNHPLKMGFTLLGQYKNFGFILFILLLKNPIWALVALACSLLVLIPYAYFSWKNSHFTLIDNTLHYTSGTFSKKQKIIPFDKITSVDFSQSLLTRPFGLYYMKIDTGSSSDNVAELSIILKKDKAESLKSRLLFNDVMPKPLEISQGLDETNQTQSQPKSILYKASFSELTLNAMTGNFLLLGLGLFWSFFAFFDDVVNLFKLQLDFNDQAKGYITGIFNKDTLSVIFAALAFFVVFSLIALIFSIISTHIRYYGFSVWLENQNIHIEYGLIKEKKYTLPVEGIKAVIIKRTPLKQLFRMNTLILSTSGYGDEEKEVSLLFPLATYNKTRNILKTLLPQFSADLTSNKPEKSVAWFFYGPPLLGISALIAFGYYFNHYSLYGLGLLPLALLAGHLEHRQTALAFSDTLLSLTRSGFYYKQVIIPFSKVQILKQRISPFQKKAGVCTYSITYQGHLISESAKARHLPVKFFKSLQDMHCTK